MQPNEIITASGLSMRFPGCEALRSIDFCVQRGQVFALLGENGAGKTTLIRILTGFQQATAGQCRVLGLDPITDSLTLRRRIGYVSDAPALYEWMTVGEIGWFAASFYPPGFLDAYRDLIAGYEVPESRKIKQLSKGQRAKVALSLAVAHDPELLILDEPTSGLDPLVRRDFLESMVTRAAAGRTVLLSSHQIAEVERVADTIAILHSGSIKVQGNLDELKTSIVEVTVTVADPLLSLPVFAAESQVWSEETSGRQRRLIVCGFDDASRRQLEQHPGVESIRQRPITLEELFVVCTRGHVREHVNIKPTAVPYGLQQLEQEWKS